MNFPAVPSLLGRGRDPGLPFVGDVVFSLFTSASGVWVPSRRKAIIIVTGPGGPGTTTGATVFGRSATGGAPGCAGGTAIKFLDCSQLNSCAWQVGQANTTDDSILTLPGMTALTGFHGITTTPGSATGGDINLKGGVAQRLMEAFYPTINVGSGEVTNFGGLGTNGRFDVSYQTGASPGGASFWGPCEVVSGNPATYGVGGWSGPGAAAGQGGPGVIAVWEF